jgi:hypothetical protein
VLQKCGRYRTNSGQTAPSGLTGSAAFDPSATLPAGLRCNAAGATFIGVRGICAKLSKYHPCGCDIFVSGAHQTSTDLKIAKIDGRLLRVKRQRSSPLLIELSQPAGRNRTRKQWITKQLYHFGWRAIVLGKQPVQPYGKVTCIKLTQVVSWICHGVRLRCRFAE